MAHPAHSHLLAMPTMMDLYYGDDAATIPIMVHYKYHPGDPGQLYGPPERCYPPEGPEAEIYRIELADKPEIEISDLFTDEQIDHMTLAALNFVDHLDDLEEPNDYADVG